MYKRYSVLCTISDPCFMSLKWSVQIQGITTCLDRDRTCLSYDNGMSRKVQLRVRGFKSTANILDKSKHIIADELHCFLQC